MYLLVNVNRLWINLRIKSSFEFSMHKAYIVQLTIEYKISIIYNINLIGILLCNI